MRAGGSLVTVESRGKFCPLQLQRLEFAVDGFVERRGRFAARLRQCLGRGPAGGLGLRGSPLQRLDLLFAGIDQCDVAIVPARQC